MEEMTKTELVVITKEEMGAELAAVIAQLLVEKKVVTDKEIFQGLRELKQVDKWIYTKGKLSAGLKERWLGHGKELVDVAIRVRPAIQK